MDCEDVATAEINLRDCKINPFKPLFVTFIFSQRESRFARSCSRVRFYIFRSKNSRAAAPRRFCHKSYSRFKLILFFLQRFFSTQHSISMPFFIFLLPSWKATSPFKLSISNSQNESTRNSNNRVRRRAQATAIDAAADRARDVPSATWSSPVYDRYAKRCFSFVKLF